MRFAIVGAGAVGGYFGARLVQAGHEVTFLARGAHLRVLRERGLTLHTPAGESLIPVRAEEDPAHVGPVDVVMLAVKTYHLPSALPSVKTLLSTVERPVLGGPTAVVLTLQNGVDSPSEVAAAVGEQAGVTDATRLSIGPLRDCPPALDTYREAAEEVARVAAAEGITVQRRPDTLLEELRGLPAHTRASLLVDLEQGRPLEVEALLGSVVRRGRAAGVPTPVLATLHGVLAPHAQGRTA